MVGDDDRDVVATEQLERLLAALGPEDAELGGEDGLEGVEDPRLVVDDQDGRLLQGSSCEVRAQAVAAATGAPIIPRIS